jgi:hypothetical protein
MKLPKRLHKNFSVVLVASLLLLGGSRAALRSSPQASAETVGGLQMTIHLDQADGGQSKAPKFRVELRDAGETDLILNLGVMLANGRKQYPRYVVLTLTDSQGKSRRLDLKEPWFVAGRMDPLVVPLPVGSTFSIPVDLEKYVAAASKEFDYKLKPGTYFLEAQFTGRGFSQREANLDMKGIALMPCWTGSITSNQLRFEFPGQ